MSGVIDTSGNYLTGVLRKYSDELQKTQRTIATGGTQADLQDKTILQTGVFLSNSNLVSRLENFQRDNGAVAVRMHMQSDALKALYNVMQDIREQLAPGRVSDGSGMPGYAGFVTKLRNEVYNILTTQDPNTSAYIFGGTGEIVNPILDIRNTTLFPGIGAGTAFSSSDYSVAPATGTISVYINDSVILDKVVITASDSSIAHALQAIMFAAASTNGTDANAVAAWTAAASAQKLLIDATSQVLQPLAYLSEKTDNIYSDISNAVESTNDIVNDDIPSALVENQRLETLVEMTDSLLLQDIRRSKKAAELMKEGI